jgi:hypothetical protein
MEQIISLNSKIKKDAFYTSSIERNYKILSMILKQIDKKSLFDKKHLLLSDINTRLSVESGINIDDCISSEGFTLTDTRLEDDHTSQSANSLGFVLQHTTNTSDELDDSDFSNWQTNNSLTYDSTVGRFGTGSALVNFASGNGQSRLVLAGGLWVGNQEIVWFKDNGDILSGSQRIAVIWANNSTGTFVIVMGFGVNAATSTSTYSYFDLATSSWIDTNILRNTDWMKLTVRTGGVVPEEGDPEGIHELYLNNTLIYSDVNYTYQLLRVALSSSTAGKTFNADRIWHRVNNTLFPTSGTVEFPAIQPNKVLQWLSYTITQTTSEAHSGTIASQFQWSTDGQATWNGTWLDLTDANLQAITCDGDGSDAIKICSTLSSGIYGTSSPRLEAMQINFNPGTINKKNNFVSLMSKFLSENSRIEKVDNLFSLIGKNLKYNSKMNRILMIESGIHPINSKKSPIEKKILIN